MSIPENVINAILNGCPVKPKEQKQELDNKVKNISDLYRQNPGVITCNHCDYPFVPQNIHRFNCPYCFKDFIQCPKCHKYIEKL